MTGPSAVGNSGRAHREVLSAGNGGGAILPKAKKTCRSDVKRVCPEQGMLPPTLAQSLIAAAQRHSERASSALPKPHPLHCLRWPAPTSPARPAPTKPRAGSHKAGSHRLHALVAVHPENFGAAVMAGQHAGDDEQQVGQAVQVPDGGFVDGFNL